MTIRDDHGSPGGASESPAGPSGGRRTRIAIGVVGLAAVLGAGAYTVTDALIKPHGDTTNVGAPERLPDGSSSGAVSASRGGSPAPSAPATTVDPQVAASIKAAREKMAKDGVKVIPPGPTGESRPVVDLARTDRGTLAEGGIVRVVSARSDLTGQQELGWVAGGITRYGDAQCSQTFRFSGGQPAKKPNLLLCWRTSAQKSVVAVVVDPKGKPSRRKAIEELHKRWQIMG